MRPSSKPPLLADAGYEVRATELARQLGVPLISEPPLQGRALQLGASGLALCSFGQRAPGPIRVDFVNGALAHRRRFGGGKGQDIARAIGLHRNAHLRVVDLTAGLGRDAFVLASLGATVVMLERHPVVAALLADGLERARAHSEDAALAAIVARMELIPQDARSFLRGSASDIRDGRPDVIYLDPMFPERHKSAQVKKEMAAFQELVGRDDDAAEVLALALQTARYRVVVKRPTGAPALGGREAGTTIAGKSTRFDIYPIQRIPSPSELRPAVG